MIFSALGLMAQPNQGIRTPNDTLQSVRIVNGNDVVLSIYAPKASEVSVIGDFLNEWKPQPLMKDEFGVWSVKISGLMPEVYMYEFNVDGVRTFDPRNPTNFKEAENGISNVFEVPGAEFEYLKVREVPHGVLEKVWFNSKVTNKVGRFHIYLPPGYEKIRDELPVLYLQHGGGDNDASWTSLGKANFILDNLISEGKAKPMVVVMPMGHPVPGFFMGLGTDEDPYYRQLFDEIMPLVESTYKVSSKSADKAYAGLSMGGLQALNIALFQPERFAYVLPLSTGYFPPQLKELEEKHSEVLKNPKINQLKLFWIAMGGEKDIAYQNGKNVLALFDKYGIKYKTNDYPKAHTFLTWRHNLAEFAPLLFR